MARFTTKHVEPSYISRAPGLIQRHIFEMAPGCNIDLSTAFQNAVRGAQTGVLGIPDVRQNRENSSSISNFSNTKANSSIKSYVCQMKHHTVSCTIDDVGLPPLQSYANKIDQLFDD